MKTAVDVGSRITHNVVPARRDRRAELKYNRSVVVRAHAVQTTGSTGAKSPMSLRTNGTLSSPRGPCMCDVVSEGNVITALRQAPSPSPGLYRAHQSQ
jgi:hypothetical protein